MQDMVRILPLLGITKPIATLTKKSRDGESSLTNAMQRRLRQVLAPIPWGVDEMAAACLACFLWIEQAKHSARDSKEMLSGQLAEGSYVHTRCARRYQPSLGLMGSKEDLGKR